MQSSLHECRTTLKQCRHCADTISFAERDTHMSVSLPQLSGRRLRSQIDIDSCMFVACLPANLLYSCMPKDSAFVYDWLLWHVFLRLSWSASETASCSLEQEIDLVGTILPRPLIKLLIKPAQPGVSERQLTGKACLHLLPRLATAHVPNRTWGPNVRPRPEALCTDIQSPDVLDRLECQLGFHI